VYHLDFEGQVRERVNMTIRMLLVDDHAIMREGMCALLKRRSDMEVVGQAGNGRMAISLARERTPDIVIMDIGIPNLDGIEATRQLIIDNPKLMVMALSLHSDTAIVLKMLHAGARGYVLKDSAFTELLDGIDALMEGKFYLCSKIAAVVLNKLTNSDWSGRDLLSSRENAVLQLVAEGKTTQDIANTLHVSVTTVNAQRGHIMEKLNIHTVAGLAKYAVREGITSSW
jgi:two-component system response regulator NreC